MRRLSVILSSVALALVVLGLTLPLWLGTAINWIGPKFGVSIGHYETIGYGRFRVTNVEVRHAPVRVTVKRVEADTPVLLLWRRWTSKPGRVIAGEWLTEVTSSAKTEAPLKSNFGWVRLQKILLRVADYLAVWVPEFEAGRGEVTWPGQKLTFSSASWKDRTIASPDFGYRILHADVSAVLPAKGAIEAKARMLDGSAVATIRSDAAVMNGHATWWDQPAELVAHFDERGWLPREAVLRAQNWALPGSRIKLGTYYPTVRGTGMIEWRDGQLRTEVSAEADARPNTPAPPLAVRIRGHGAADTFVAEALEINLPGIQGHLSGPVAIDRDARLRSEPSNFTFEADLARQPWFTARGTFKGSGRITAGTDQRVQIDFSASGDDLTVLQMPVSHAAATGGLEWPILKIAEGNLVSSDQSKVVVRGGLNVLTREILDASIHGRVDRSLFARWLPAYPKFGPVDIEATANGPWTSFNHKGSASAKDVSFAQTQPMAVVLNWTGEAIAVTDFTAKVTAGDGAISAAGSADRSRLRLAKLDISEAETPRLKLDAPTELQWGESIRLSPTDLSGPDASLHAVLMWGKKGDAEFRVQHFPSEWLKPWLLLPAIKGQVDSAELSAHWDNGPAQFHLNGGATVELGNDRAAQIATTVTGSEEGVTITNLRVAEGGGEIVAAKGRLPLVINPAGNSKWGILEKAPFSFDASTTSNPEFWEKITQLTGVEIVDPAVAVHIDGSLSEPRGDARISASRLAPRDPRLKGIWPSIGTLNLHATGDQSGVTVEEFSVAIEGQTVRASGRVPIEVNTFRDLRSDPGEVVRRSELHLEVPDAEIAAFVHYFPEYIAPKGRFHLDLRFKGEKSVDGFIRLDGGASRPLGPLGVLQEINADIRFSERTAKLQAVTARMGGQLVTLQGSAHLTVGRQPELDLTLKGENLPFVRRAGLLVRGDLDLKLASNRAATPLISGVVRLRESLFLADIRSLLPSGAKGGAGRPPYFSIETPPLNTWGIDVQVLGEKFLRLRTPVFNGTATARFRLDGTLGEPRIGGEAIVDQGTIRLPFSSFEVQQGEVRLSAGEVEPKLYVAATARRYGYDLRMEVSGSTTSPNLRFSSSPPLEAEQLLLMVMAGEAPRNEVSTTDRQRVARFGAFFGQTILGSLGGDPTGADRLTISSGRDISKQGRETYSIEYRLSNRWAVTGEYDEFDDYYGGLKRRIYPKGEHARDEKK